MAKRRRVIEPHSHDDVLDRDIRALLGPDARSDAPFNCPEEVDVRIDTLSSLGHALAAARDWAIVIPFALPGELVRVRVYRNAHRHSLAEIVKVLEPNTEWRDDTRVQCKYFGKCSGCQYQMLSYEKQLDIKRDVLVKAYTNFSGRSRHLTQLLANVHPDLRPSQLPSALPTVGSPKQYHYRTKITPHFEAPTKKARSNPTNSDWLKIGFNQIGRKSVIDIEECPIATSVLNKALGPIRQNIFQNIWSYKKGVSLLLRDSLDPALPVDTTSPDDPDTHICITDHKAIVRERVGNTFFEFPGHAFFQNNNAILVPLTNYVRDAIFSTDSCTPPTHLVDAYCGSGLFSILLAPHFSSVTGIELASDAIRAATSNAALNNLPKDKCTFLAGDASDIFATVTHFPRENTAVIIDPPRKGCDPKFIDQLLAFGARIVVYVSCNVHTQARDVGDIVSRSHAAGNGQRYVLESLRGFDLFPQTAHVESVAVLRMVSDELETAL